MADSKKYNVEVIKRYGTEFPDPLRLKKGDVLLSVSNKKTAFKGWVWCESAGGNKGWIPQNYITKSDEKNTMTVDYDATEMNVDIGERLKVLKEESDWLWCVNGKNEKGWVPKENVRTVQE